MLFLTSKKDCQANYIHLSVLADILLNMSRGKEQIDFTANDKSWGFKLVLENLSLPLWIWTASQYFKEYLLKSMVMLINDSFI